MVSTCSDDLEYLNDMEPLESVDDAGNEEKRIDEASEDSLGVGGGQQMPEDGNDNDDLSSLASCDGAAGEKSTSNSSPALRRAASAAGSPSHHRRGPQLSGPNDVDSCAGSDYSVGHNARSYQGVDSTSGGSTSIGLSGMSGDMTECWMRSRGIGGSIGTSTDDTPSSRTSSQVHGTGGGNGGSDISPNYRSHRAHGNFTRGGRRGREAEFHEETASSSSATLSLQLPFSDDEFALLGSVDQTFLPGAEGGELGGLGDASGLSVRGRCAAVDGLTASMMKTRMLAMNEELERLERQRASLESELLQERARHQSETHNLEKRWLEQISALKNSQERLELERDSLETRLRDKKDMFKDLAMSDALARDLRRIPEEDQTIKEYVSLKVFDLVASSKGELERTRRELEKTQEQLLATTESGDLQRREDARARRLATAREEGLKVDVEALKQRVDEMAARAREAERAAQENKNKARRFDEVEALLCTTQMELDAARALSKTQADALVDVAESEKAAVRNAQDAAQRSSILEMDTTYLKRELAEAQSRVDRLSREAEAAGDRLRDLERAKDALGVELMTVRDRARTERDEKLEAEVARLREQSAKELADIRVSGREVFERENQALRESRKDLLQEVQRVRSEKSELQRAHEDLVMRAAKSEAAHEAALAEVRGDLRLKSFELSQLGVAHSEKCSSLRQAELEMEMLREQVTVHRGEFGELEASTTRRISELQILLEAERNKVRAFEELELEVDGAVMRTGREMLLAEEQDHSETPQHQTSVGDRVSGSLVDVSSSASGERGELVLPTGPQRRLRQAVLLAHKLLKKEAELDMAKRELTDTQHRAKALETRAKKAESLLMTTEQPTRYMVDAIRSKECEVDLLRSAQRRLEAKVEALEETCREANAEKTKLERKLQQRGKGDVSARSSGASDGNKRGLQEKEQLISGFDHLGETGVECEGGGAPESVRKAPSSLEKLTVHGGKRVSQGGPKWYSYRQSKLVRVPP